MFSFIIFKAYFQTCALNLAERKMSLNSSLLNLSGGNKKMKQYRNEMNKSQESKKHNERR